MSNFPSGNGFKMLFPCRSCCWHSFKSSRNPWALVYLSSGDCDPVNNAITYSTLFAYLISQFFNNHRDDHRSLRTDLMNGWQLLVEDIMYNLHGAAVGKRQWLCQCYKKCNAKTVKIRAMIRLKCCASSLFRRHVNQHLQEIVGSISLHSFSPTFRCQTLFKASGSRSKIPDFDRTILWP